MLEQTGMDLVSPEEFDSPALEDEIVEMDQEDDPEEGLLEEFVVPEKKAPKEKELSVTALATVNSLQRYLAEIRPFPALSKEEEFDLAVRYKGEGDTQAAHRLVTSHLLLVVKIAMLYRQVHSNLLDLIQEGNVGLLEAIKRFDPYRNLRLSTYAAWWIRAYILKFILDNWKLVKVGTSNARRKLFYNLKKEKDRLEAEGNGYGSRLLAERLQVKEDDVIDLDRYLSNEDISLDAPVDLNSSRTYADRIASDERPIDEQLAEEEFDRLFWEKIHRFSEGLSPRDRLILEQRLLSESPMTLQEIGEKHGVTRETVRQAEKRLLRRLRTYLKQELPEYINVQFTPMGERPAQELSAL